MSEKKEVIGIIGTGNYGIAIGKRLLDYGYEIVYGSRNPNLDYLKECFQVVRNDGLFSVTSSAEAWKRADRIVFFAVTAFDSVYEGIVNEIVTSLKKKVTNKSKIVIDISNIVENSSAEKIKISNAEKLQNLFQARLEEQSVNCQINIVKGFNLTSAYTLSSSGESKESLTSGLNQTVPIAGDDFKSKESVIQFCNKIGFRAYDVGSLNGAALKLELVNKKTFNDWYYPSLMSLLFFLFNFAWIFFNYYFFPKKPHTFEKYLHDFSLLSHTNKVMGYTSLQLMAFVYFTSVLASVYQLVNSTKYKRFPKYLDFSLKSRKQFGLWAFYFATIHVIATIYIMNPLYLADWFRQPNKFSSLTILTLNGELALLIGILAFVLLIVLALTSINAIGSCLTWNEWRFVQTNLGLTALFLGLLHTAVMYTRIYNEKDKFNYSYAYLLTRAKLIACYFPLVTLALRFVFAYFPPISNRLDKIRLGLSQKESKKE